MKCVGGVVCVMSMKGARGGGSTKYNRNRGEEKPAELEQDHLFSPFN